MHALTSQQKRGALRLALTRRIARAAGPGVADYDRACALASQVLRLAAPVSSTPFTDSASELAPIPPSVEELRPAIEALGLDEATVQDILQTLTSALRVQAFGQADASPAATASASAANGGDFAASFSRYLKSRREGGSSSTGSDAAAGAIDVRTYTGNRTQRVLAWCSANVPGFAGWSYDDQHAHAWRLGQTHEVLT